VKRSLGLLVVMALLGLTQTSAGAREHTYESYVLKNVFVETRYGDRMNIDLCFPSNDGVTVAPGRFPVLAELTPYMSAGQAQCGETGGSNELLIPEAVKHGYVGAHVNSPGTGESDGGPWDYGDPSYALRHYDAVEWLGVQPWSTGKVGTAGGSGVGVSQVTLAPYRPPHLTTSIMEVSTGDAYLSLKPGGMRHGTELLVCAIPGGKASAEQGLYTPPTSQADVDNMIRIQQSRVFNTQGVFHCPPLHGSWAHPTRDGYWDARTARLEKVRMPVWVWGSPDDLFSLGSQDDYFLLGSKDKAFTFGFNSHGGSKPGFDQTKEALRWMDYWLKGIDTGIKRELETKRFRYNVFPDFVTKSAKAYPIPSTRYTNFYLNTGSPDPLATGSLTLNPPKAEGSSTYVYTPTDGKGYNPFGAGEQPDQRAEAGASRVSYLFDPAAKDTEVTGPITMKLYASTTATDTDWVGKLIDVSPDGTWTHVPTNGYLKGTFRSYKGDYRKQWAIPANEVVGYDIQFYPTSWNFKKGHRIGVALSSGDVGETYPNPNPAVITVHHSPKYPSAITLPVIPG
jgi:putative CocE/NonD family hydrolase